MKTNATGKRRVFEEQFVPLIEWLSLIDEDWQQAAGFWAEARKNGRQLSDVDLLLAAVTKRLDAILISNDNDFDALSIKRENWRDDRK